MTYNLAILCNSVARTIEFPGYTAFRFFIWLSTMFRAAPRFRVRLIIVGSVSWDLFRVFANPFWSLGQSLFDANPGLNGSPPESE